MNRVVAAATGAAFTVAGLAQVRAEPRPNLERTNYRGRSVSLAGGLATAVGTLAGVASAGGRPAMAGALAVGAASAFGALDDLTEQPQARATKGLRGHLGALRRGEVTTGFVKLAGITTAGLAAGAILASSQPRRSGPARALDAFARGALIAGTANLVNLLDLRPGRALKVVGALTGTTALVPSPGAAVAAGVLGAVGAALPSDLAETTMLGDTGANAIGAGVGTALAALPCPWVRGGALAVVIAATLASERVSFSAVIERTPWLKALDDAGRA